MNKALITGITGQDGSYLAELLLNKGYEVHGIIRRSSVDIKGRISHILDNQNLHLHFGDLVDSDSLTSILYNVEPNEIYNLGAQSHVRVSFDNPSYTGFATGLGTQNLLTSISTAGLLNKTRFYQASSSEMYGKVQEIPQVETTPFWPRSPYGCAKLYSYWLTINYRESFDFHGSNGILFNHESPRRAEEFVTRKITRAATRIKLGLQKDLKLGNLDAKRDWGYAKEFVEAMWLMLQQDQPDDYVVATNETYSIRDFLGFVFEYLDLDYQEFVKYDPNLERPAEVDLLIGDPAKAKAQLGWEPKTSVRELAKIMVDADLKLAHQEKILLNQT